MPLSSYNGQCVRIVDALGDSYDGQCRWFPADHCLRAFGWREEALQVGDRLFYLSNIQSVRELSGPPELWKSRRQHFMRLAPGPFSAMKSGRKTVELRLWDEKRRQLKEGDVKCFACSDGGAETLRVQVTELLRFPTFAELYRSVPPEDMGYEPGAPASPEDMNVYYSPGEQARWGVVGIRVERI